MMSEFGGPERHTEFIETTISALQEVRSIPDEYARTPEEAMAPMLEAWPGQEEEEE